jgi:hypothetical protein
MIDGVARSLDVWALREEEPSTHTLLSMQLPGRKSGPLLLARLAHKKRPRECARQWREDGCDRGFAPNVANATSRQCGRYANATCELMSKEPLVELVFDASRFGGRDIEVFYNLRCVVGCSGVVAASRSSRARMATGCRWFHDERC